MGKFKADILVVDDTLSNLLLLERILTKHGYTTRCIPSGELALAEVQMYCPDLILLDIHMPGLNGYEVCQHFKTMPTIQDVPIIFLSALDSVADKIKAFDLGAADYITKPFQAQEVLARIKHQLKIRDLQKQLEEQNTRLQREIQDRNDASTALILSEAKFATAFRSTPHAIAITRRDDGCHLDVNDSFLEFSGYTRSEIIGRTSLELNMWQNFDDRQKFIQTLTQKGYVRNQEIELRLRSGEIGVGLISAEPITINGENCIISVLSDISDRKKAEENLRRSEAKFRSLLENIADALFVHDLEGNITDVNQRACQNLGYTRDELLNLTVFDIEVGTPPETLKSAWKAMKPGTPITINGINRHKDGCTFPIEARVGIFELSGELSVIGLIRDVSARVAAEEALRSTEEKYRSIFENAVEGIYQTTHDGQYLSANPALAQLYGYESAGEMMFAIDDVGKELYVDPHRRQDFIDLMEACGTISGFESQVYRKDGSIIWISENARTVRDSQGRLLYYEGLVENITARKLAEAELQRAKEVSDQANRAKSEFLSNMSHELRTPLNAILGFTQVLVRDASLSPDHQESLQIINRSGEHLLCLINDVLEMSKIEAGRATLNCGSFDLHYLLMNIEEMLKYKAKSKQLRLTCEIAPNVPRYISGDEGKLRQVLINLMGNAIKFTNRGTVTLRVQTTGINPDYQQLLFEVQDTGTGIAAHEIDSLFEAFIQSTSGRKSQEGTGLGLPISRQFVRLMGGDITVSSTVGVGTIFSFEIPVPNSQEQQPMRQLEFTRQVAGLAPHQPQYRILIVEDRRENQQVLLKLLEPLGFEVKLANNGEEGIEIWETWMPHLIWMDMRMPIMDGYTATKIIKGTPQGQSTVIIALTASAFEEERSQVVAAGCDDFVRKPFPAELIFTKMGEHLGLQYIYAEIPNLQQRSLLSNSSNSLGTSKPELTPQDLEAMSTEWREQMHLAASQLDEDRILELIDQVSNGNLANGLRNLVNTFRFDQLLDLTKD
ncbi:PAS domain S-box [Synechococcus sp. PCC 7502]|uniref:PAS domain S-box protein n=1 Tax=Synechococcus sp. PCC 7502 TaxID=1173263 RepID=UPI00029FB522|nr:PAS domain S-box protein [Synechococcus sp. PCC 7502]AFY72455.1 PAS domain S-box [Synechococcus sp. PCC 7502]